MLFLPRYKWHDEFGDQRATGTLADRPATSETGLVLPGTNLSTIVDTETCLSIIPNLSAVIADQTGVTFGGSNNRCSYAAGYSWMDFPTGFNASLHAEAGRIVVMYDGTRACWGYLGAAGSGETLGIEIITSWLNVTPTYAFETWTVSGTDITSAINTDGFGIAYKTITVDDGKLLKCVNIYTLNSGTAPAFGLMYASVLNPGSPAFDLNATSYRCKTLPPAGGGATNNCVGFRVGAASNFSFTSPSLKEVLTPSATGCWVYKTLAAAVAGDMVQSGWNKPAGFNPNFTTATFSIHDPLPGGKLFFMGGKATAAYGDPGWWKSEAITREAGRIIAFKLTTKDATLSTAVGLDTDKTGELDETRIRIAGDTLLTYDGATAGPVFMIPADNTDYVLVIILRAAGAQFFVKTGAGYYKRIWSNNTSATASLYAAIHAYSAVAFYDRIRDITTKWLPTPLLSDSFTGSACTNDGRVSDGAGHAETTGLGSGGIATWSGASGAVDGSGNLVITPTLGAELNSGDVVVGNWYQITATQANFFYTGCAVGNTFRCATAKTLSADNKVKLITLATCYNTVTLSTKDIELKAVLTVTAGTQSGLIFGLNDAGTSFIRATLNGTLFTLEICETGVYTSKASIANTNVAAVEVRAQRDDAAIWCWVNNVLMGTGPTTTLSAGENTNLSGLKAGLFSTSELNSFASVSGYPVGTGGEFQILQNLIGA